MRALPAFGDSACGNERNTHVLHAKSIVVDGDHATVATANIDYRSFFLNYELNLFTRDTRLCALSAEIHDEHWSHRPWTQKFLELIGWLARRWL